MGVIRVNSKSLQRRFPCFPPESCVSGTQFSSWTCGCSLAFTLGIPIFDLHSSVHRLILARETHILDQEKKLVRNIFSVYDNLVCNFFCSFSQIFNILVIDSDTCSFKTARECLLLTQCILMGGCGFL